MPVPCFTARANRIDLSCYKFAIATVLECLSLINIKWDPEETARQSPAKGVVTDTAESQRL